MNENIDRRTFGFALKDELPLKTGRHRYEYHNDGCNHANGPTEGACYAVKIEIVQLASENAAARAIRGISVAAEPRLASRASREEQRPDTTSNSSYILASVVIDHNREDSIRDAYQSAMEAIRMRVDSIRIAMSINLPPMSFERFYPMYHMYLESPDGELIFERVVIDEYRVNELAVQPASKEDLALADSYMFAGSANDPAELIADLNQRCRTLLRSGDYLLATVVAATASEVLLKTLSCALVWEARTYGPDSPEWAIGRSKLLKANSATLLTEVLPGSLGDFWSDQLQSDPLWNWRNRLYKIRNKIVHEGHRPNDVEARLAVEAYEGLNTHVVDRLASRAQDFPRCALMLVGRPGLEKRGAWGKVRATAQAETSRSDFSDEYLRWIG